MKQAVLKFLRNEEGATAIEYGIIAGLMATLLVTIFATDGTLGAALTTTFTNIANTLTGT